MIPHKSYMPRETLTYAITLIFGLFLLFIPSTLQAAENISLQLKWKHAFQFAGFYMAQEKGFYEEADLSVTLIEGGPGKTSVDFALQAEGRYGVADTGALLSHANGKRIKALAAIFQHSPLALAVLDSSGIRDFSDLRGKRIMMQTDNMDAVISASIQKAGLNEADFTRQANSFNLHDLINGNTDAFSVYLTDQPHQLIERGIAHRILNPREYDIDFYGDILITSETETLKHPERAQTFIKASLKGWQYALDHVDETIEIIQSKYNSQNLSSSQLYFEAKKTADMVLKDVVNPGYMSHHRWQVIARTYAELGSIPDTYSADQFLYVPEANFRDFIITYQWQLIIIGLFILLLFFGFQATLLRRMVGNRTKALHESESRFRTLVGNIPGAVFRYNPERGSNMNYISAEIENISGYPASDFINNSLTYRSITHEDDREQVITTIQQNLERKTAYALEYRIIKSDGSECWVLESGKVSHEINSPTWIDGCIFNISERKQAEKLKSTTSDILKMVASDKSLNQIFTAIVQSYESRYPGMKASILRVVDGRLCKGAAPNLPEKYNNAIDGLEIGPMVGSCGSAAFNKERTISEDMEHDPRWAPYLGLTMPMNLRACWSEPIFNSEGEVLGTFGMYYDHVRSPSPEEIIDISNAAKLTGIAMQREQNISQLKKLSQAIEQSREVITIMNREWVVEYLNPAFTEVTGFEQHDVIGKKSQLLSSNENQAIVEQLWQALDKGESWQGKITEVRKDGTHFPAMLTTSPIRNEDGEISHFISVLEDLSQLHQMEAQFQQAQKMESIGTLVGGIAHDFNNMLAAMQGNLYLTRKLISDNPRAISKLDNMEQLGTHASNMIQQLLTFARKDRVLMQPLALNSFLQEAFKLASRSIPENIERRCNVCDESLVVIGDSTQLQQILMNLLNNARGAVINTPQPSINCSLVPFTATEEFLLLHPEAETDSFAHICIQDNGCGIPDSIRDKIFEPFFTTKNIGEGTGLGLAMVYGAIKTHAGYIDLKSSAESGTAFHIYLPQAASRSSELIDQESAVLQGHGETILVVDDDPNIRETTSEVLKSLAYNVIEAENGQLALDIYRELQKNIDLIISDLVMPVMGGAEMAKHIRQINQYIPVIFASGYDKEADFDTKNVLPESLYLNKPFTVEKLSQSVRTLLDAKE